MRAISEDLRIRIVTVYEEGKSSFPQVAERFRASMRSVRRFVRQFRETGDVVAKPVANGRHPKLGMTDIRHIREVTDSKPDVPQDEPREMLGTATGTAVSKPTICRTLRRERITRRKKTKRAKEQERDDAREARRQFSQEMQPLRPEDLPFIDEAGCVTGMSRTYGYAPCGKRAVPSEPAGKGTLPSVIGALSQDGFVGGPEVRGSADGDVFEAFVRNIVVPHPETGRTVLMDNVPSNHREGIRELMEASGAVLKCMPPYSPESDPIEECWSEVRAWLGEKSARTVGTLRSAITEAIARITESDVRGWFRHAGYQCQQ